MTQPRQFPPEVAEQLRSYVYLYVDPRNHQTFYVGKGVGNRAFAHLEELGESRKLARIASIREGGHEPIIEILRHGLSDDHAALVEASVIDLLGLEQLTNQVRGMHSNSLGRISTDDVLLIHTAQPADITHPLLLITINRLYRSGVQAQELYEATRGVWKIGTRRNKAQYACAVFQGVIREVYAIDHWQPAGTDAYLTRLPDHYEVEGRWEFVGKPAPDDIRERYCRRSVRNILGPASQNPIRYVLC